MFSANKSCAKDFVDIIKEMIDWKRKFDIRSYLAPIKQACFTE